MNFTPGRGTVRLTASAYVSTPLDAVFSFFSNCHNLQRLTPESMKFRVLTPQAEKMRRGLLIDYRLSLHGIPFHWQSEITVWEPPFRFVDEQRSGPYRQWVHEHRFEEKDGGTLVTDTVDYAVPGGPLVDRLFVRRQLRGIFQFRADQLKKSLA